MPDEIRSTCPYCGVGCGVLIATDGQRITGVRGDPAHPANLGRLCSKGSTLHLTADPVLAQQTRLLAPQLRTQRSQAPQPTTWEAALDHVAHTLARTVQQHGPDAVAIYASGQLLTEDYYVFNKLAKGLLGTNNIDTNSRLCMSSAVAGYKATLGADAPPTCYDDVDHAQCLFITGSNTAWAHPVLFRRIEAAKARRPQLKIIVADPRRTETAQQADLYLPIQPGTDVLLYHGMLHLMLWEGWVDMDYIARHTSGFEALKAVVREATPAHVARTCGIPEADLLQAARWFALGGHDSASAPRQPTLSLYCQGLNQSSSGTANNAALINLHLACGHIGKAGAGPFSLTGQPNAMGGREVGGLSNLLSAHRDMANPAHRAEVAALWGVPDVPATPGKSAIDLFQAVADGHIKCVWIVCTNPAHSLPQQTLVRQALERAECVIVQDAFATTATAAYADVLLPATTWGEKLGTVTNSERCISRVRAAVPPMGQARHDWAIAVQVAQRVQALLHPELPNLFPYDTAHAAAGAQSIWQEHRASTRGRDLDITGLSWDMLEAQGPQYWPLPEGSAQGHKRLYTDGHYPTADGRARFDAQPWRPVAEPRSAQRPFSLTTGRLREHWHGMSRTGQLARLFAHTPEPAVGMHPQDMARQQLRAGQLVAITSRYGRVIAPVQPDDSVAPMQLFMAMHWGGEYLGGRDGAGGINTLTTPTYCPQSKQPELKHTPVHIAPAQLPWSLVAAAWLPAHQVLATRQALAALFGHFAFASCVPFGEAASAMPTSVDAASAAPVGVLLRAANTAPVDAKVLARIRELLSLGSPELLHYTDSRNHHSRSLRLRTTEGAPPTLDGLLLCGDSSASAWLLPLLHSRAPLPCSSQALLNPSATAPTTANVAPRSRVVCSCWGVDEASISATLAQCTGSDAERLHHLQSQLHCGTQCGSCLPQLRQLVRSTAPEPHAKPAPALAAPHASPIDLSELEV